MLLGSAAGTALAGGTAILLWASGALPEHVTALLFMLLAVVLGIAPPEVVFSGFHSPALWLVVSGMVMGVAIRHTGLGARLSRAFLDRAPASYSGVLAALVLSCLLLSFVMPSSMGRIVLLLPMVLSLADEARLPPGSRERSGLVITVVLAAYLPSAGILPANIPNLILVSAAESIYGITLTYADYFAAAFVPAGVAKLVVILAVGLAYGRPALAPRRHEPPSALSLNERRLSLLLACSLMLWASDALHGINPAWIGLGAAILCMLPPIRAVDGRAFNQDVSWAAVIHTAGIIGLGAVIAFSGLGASLGQGLATIAPFAPGYDLWNLFVLNAMSIMICMVTTTPGQPAVMTPLAGMLAEASGLPLKVVLYTQVLAFATIVFPYQGAPLVFAFHAGGVPLRHAVGFLAAVTAGTLFFITPLAYAWWRWVGILL